MKRDHICWILYLSGFLDLCGVGLVMSLIPSRARDIGASTTATGILGSVYGGVQLLSSPIMGKWADSVSRKSSILLSLILSSVGYAVMGWASSLAVLVAARVILGCFKHCQTMCRAYLADFITEKERATVLGRFNSFSSIGFIVGPTIGGHLAESSFGFSLVAAITALVFALNAVLMWGFLPNGDHKTRSLSSKAGAKSLLENGEASTEGKSSKEERKSLVLISFWDLFLFIFFGSFSVIIYRNNFSLLMREKFLASPKTLGYITSFTGLVSTVCGFLVGKITDRRVLFKNYKQIVTEIHWRTTLFCLPGILATGSLAQLAAVSLLVLAVFLELALYKNNDAKLIRHVTVAQLLVFVGLSQAPSIPVTIALLAPLSVITSVTRVATTSITIQRCGKDRLAGVMGWSQSVTSVARMMAPFLAGLAQEWSMDAACYVSVVACCINLVVITAFPQGSKEDNNIHSREKTRVD